MDDSFCDTVTTRIREVLDVGLFQGLRSVRNCGLNRES